MIRTKNGKKNGTMAAGAIGMTMTTMTMMTTINGMATVMVMDMINGTMTNGMMTSGMTTSGMTMMMMTTMTIVRSIPTAVWLT